MRRPTSLAALPVQFAPAYQEAACPVQILVIDRLNGPADVLIGTISRLLDREVSVTTVNSQADALRALHCLCFELVVIGLETHQLDQLAVLPYLQAHAPDVPVIVVGRALAPLHDQAARRYGARAVLEMPVRAADLKALVVEMRDHYLHAREE